MWMLPSACLTAAPMQMVLRSGAMSMANPRNPSMSGAATAVSAHNAVSMALLTVCLSHTPNASRRNASSDSWRRRRRMLFSLVRRG